LAVFAEVAGDITDAGFTGAAAANRTTSFHDHSQMTRCRNMRDYPQVTASSALVMGRA
jgi:hypothetical protein